MPAAQSRDRHTRQLTSSPPHHHHHHHHHHHYHHCHHHHHHHRHCHHHHRDITKKALTSFTGKDEYEFGDVSKKILGDLFGPRKRGKKKED